MSTKVRPSGALPGYRIERLLGRGGMGEVYLAEEEGLGRKVALKLLAPELARDERFRARFLAESRLAAALEHPHVVPVYAAGERDGQLYLAMRYVEGEDLRTLLAREGALPRERALELLSCIAAALDTAHARRLLHRDVKPANVLLDHEGNPYLTDFGLAREFEQERPLTRTGELMGTVGYCSPEQIEGRSLDARSDLYALACLAFECFAGEPPFARENEAAVLFAHLREPPPPLSERDADLAPLDPVFAQALAKAAEERHARCGEFVRALEQALARSAATLQVAPALPRFGTHFLGRERELAEVRDSLRGGDVRLVTLTGPGGVGKTRLATAAAEALASDFRDGVFFVDLSPLRERALVLPTIAAALGLGAQGLEPVQAALCAMLADRELLLVLDALEAVPEHALDALTAAAPGLTLLVTRGSPLRSPEEREYELPPLGDDDAVALFVERATSVRSEFRATADNEPLLRELCARLGGLPLAIEIAAARMKVLPLEALNARLEQRLAAPAASEETVRAAIEWSYELLSSDEQRLLARLAVFAGGSTLEAAEAVCEARLDDIAALVEKSMVTQHGAHGAPRFSLPSAIGEFAHERLHESGDAEAVRRRHAAYFCAFAEGTADGADEASVEQLEPEHHNVRAVLRWALDGGDADAVVRLASALGRVWGAHGYGGAGPSMPHLRWMLEEVHGALLEVQNRQALQIGAQREQLELQRGKLAQTNLLLTLQEPGTAGTTAADAVAVEDTLPPADVPCPYKGLEAFQPEDAEFFFGREELVADFLARLAEAHFLVVVGASGSGKSSLVRAGLLPAIGAGGLPGSSAWKTVLMTPGQHPLEELGIRLAALQGLSPASLVSDLRGDPHCLALAIRQALLDEPEGTRLVLVVDQFEEVFTLCRDEDERRAFVDALRDAAAASDLPAVVILAVRADFYGQSTAYPEFAATLQDHQALVGAMSELELRHAIERPAAKVGLALQPGLVETILRDVSEEPGALPLLSHALLETWKRRRGRTLTLTGYAEAGGVREAIARTAESVLQELTPDEREIARGIFLRLTELGEGTEHTRRRASRSELVSQGDDGEAVEAVLSVLTDARLVTTSEESVEVAHEALIREWPTLRRWLDEGRESLRVHRRLSEAAEEWHALGRDPGALYRGARLQTASEWADRHGAELNALEREFVESSRAAHESELEATRRRNRRLRLLSLGLAALVLLAAASAAVALRQRERADTKAELASSASLVQAASSVGDQVDLSSLLSLEAYRARPTLEAKSNLLAAVQRSERIVQYLRAHERPVRAVGFSANGRLLASGGSDGEVVLWNVARRVPVGAPLRSGRGQVEEIVFANEGRLLVVRTTDAAVLWDVSSRREVRRFANATSIGVSADGTRLAVGGEDGRVVVWDVDTRRAVGAPLRHRPGGVSALAFSPDGTRLAGGGIDGATLIWNVSSGTSERVLAPPGNRAFVRDLAFSPDGRRLASVTGQSAVYVWALGGRGAPMRVNRAGGPVLAVAFAPDGRTLAWGSGNTVVLWDGRRETVAETLVGHANAVKDIAFSPDGRLLASAGFDRAVILWGLRETPLARSLPGEDNPVFAVAFSPDGRLLASAGLNAPFVLRDVASGRRLPLREGGGGQPDSGPFEEFRLGSDVAFAPDGRLVAAAGGDGSVTLWDPVRRAPRGGPLRDPDGRRARSVAFDPSGELLAWGTQEGAVVLWDVQARRRVGRPLAGHSDAVNAVAFTGDGELLASASDDGTIRLWDVSSRGSAGEPLRGPGDPVTGIAFAPDGRTLASADSSDVVTLWSVEEDPVTRAPMDPHPGAERVAFTPDGAVVASGSREASVVLWDVERRTPLGSPLDAGAAVGAVSFSPDGGTLAAGTETGTIVLWDDMLWRDVAAAQDRLCGLVGRNLTRAEWDEFLPGEDYRKTCGRWPLSER